MRNVLHAVAAVALVAHGPEPPAEQARRTAQLVHNEALLPAHRTGVAVLGLVYHAVSVNRDILTAGRALTYAPPWRASHDNPHARYAIGNRAVRARAAGHDRALQAVADSILEADCARRRRRRHIMVFPPAHSRRSHLSRAHYTQQIA